MVFSSATVGAENVIADFKLAVQEFQMEEVVIKKGEDPAIEIIRETIKKRDFYNTTRLIRSL